MNEKMTPEQIPTIAKELNIPMPALIKFYNSRLNFLIDIGTDKEQAKTLALNQVVAILRKGLATAVRYQNIYFIPLGLSRTIDTTKKLVEKCFEEMNKNKDEAIRLGYISPEGTPLDYRQKTASGRDNFRYKKPIPLPPASYLRFAFGVAKIPETNEIFPAFLNIRGALCENNLVPLKAYKVNIISRGLQGDFLSFTTGQASVFEELNETFDINKLLHHEKLKSFFVNLKDINEWHTKNEGNFNRVYITQADICAIINPTTTSDNYQVLVSDWTSGVDKMPIAIIPRELLENIGIGSRVWLIGSTMGIDGEDLRLMVMGVVPIDIVAPEEASVEPVKKLKEVNPEDKWIDSEEVEEEVW